MDMIEKVERLRERANVTYEEARAALEMTGGDLLDAIVLLEKQGKLKEPAHSTFSTEYEKQKAYIRVRDKVEEQEKSAPSFGRSIGKLFRGIIRFIKETTFIVKKGEEVYFKMPTLVFVLLLFFFWEILAPVMIIALFFDIRYAFGGEKEAEKANFILNRAGDFAEDIRSEFTGQDKKDNQDRQDNQDEGPGQAS